MRAMAIRTVRAREWLPYVLVGAIVVFATYRDFGTTWDDPFHAKVGALALRYFESGLRDLAIDRYDDARFYGPLHDLVPALIRGSGAALDAAHFELRHLWNGLFALLLVPAFLRFARGFGTRTAGPLALLALVALPRFSGDVILNSKDVPFAVAMVWFHLALVETLLRGSRGDRWLALGAGIGFALLERPGAFPLLLAEVLAVLAIRDLLLGARERAPSRTVPGLLAALALAWCVMIAPWPSAHREPLLHPLRAMGAAARFYTEYPVLWEGGFRSSAELPRGYLPKMLAITTPFVVAAYAAFGAVAAVIRALRRRSSRSAVTAAVTFTWFCCPLVIAVVTRPNVYDGVRHFLFLLPAVAILAGYGASRVAAALPGRFGALRTAVVAASLALPLVDLARLHPYAYAYFNGSVGGVAGASGRYETDYFLTSYREAMERINERARRDPGRTFVVLVGGAESMIEGVAAHAGENVEVRLARPDRVWPDHLPDDVDLYLGGARFRMADTFRAEPVVMRVERDGAVFAVVRARQGIW